MVKKYEFEIKTLKNLQDSNSSHTLSKFEFLATSLESAEKYRDSLAEHYNENMPFRPQLPKDVSLLIEKVY